MACKPLCWSRLLAPPSLHGSNNAWFVQASFRRHRQASGCLSLTCVAGTPLQSALRRLQPFVPRLVLDAGAGMIPHPAKADRGGEDAFFICERGFAMGVADGVGGWAEVGGRAGEGQMGRPTAGQQQSLVAALHCDSCMPGHAQLVSAQQQAFVMACKVHCHCQLSQLATSVPCCCVQPAGSPLAAVPVRKHPSRLHLGHTASPSCQPITSSVQYFSCPPPPPQVGVDPGLYSRELMRHANAATSSCQPGEPRSPGPLPPRRARRRQALRRCCAAWFGAKKGAVAARSCHHQVPCHAPFSLPGHHCLVAQLSRPWLTHRPCLRPAPPF